MSELTADRMYDKWMEALEGGIFEQYVGGLKEESSETKFCCLGVNCEVYRRETGEGEWTHKGEFEIGDELEVAHLPSKITDLMGLSGQDVRELWRMNDDLGYNFDEIAGVIREYREGEHDTIIEARHAFVRDRIGD